MITRIKLNAPINGEQYNQIKTDLNMPKTKDNMTFKDMLIKNINMFHLIEDKYYLDFTLDVLRLYSIPINDLPKTFITDLNSALQNISTGFPDMELAYVKSYSFAIDYKAENTSKIIKKLKTEPFNNKRIRTPRPISKILCIADNNNNKCTLCLTNTDYKEDTTLLKGMTPPKEDIIRVEYFVGSYDIGKITEETKLTDVVSGGNLFNEDISNTIIENSIYRLTNKNKCRKYDFFVESLTAVIQ